jgi:hypothetical protein
MCLIILPKEDRFGEWTEAIRERRMAVKEKRRRLLYEMLPCLRPNVTVNEGTPQQKDIEPPQYASKVSLPLDTEVVK